MKRRNRRLVTYWPVFSQGLDFVSVTLERWWLEAIIKHPSHYYLPNLGKISLKKRKILRLGFTLVEIMHTKTFWVVFTTLSRECRCWPHSLSSPSSRSALGQNALVSLRVEHLAHTTSFLHFLLQSERALHEVHKKFLWSDCKCFRSHGVFYWGSVVAFISFFGLAYGSEILSAAACTDGGPFIVNLSRWDTALKRWLWLIKL